MSRTRSVFDDRELVELLAGEPELLAIADALVVTLGPEYTAHRQAAALRRRAKRLAPLAATLAAVVALLLVAPWQRGPSLVENALAAVGDGPVLYVVVEQPAPEESLRDLSTGKVLPRNVRTEIWFDGGRDLKKTLMTLDGAVLDEVLETRQGGWTRGGRVYTCAWIAAHPVEATKARVSCDPSGENGTTPRTVPERPPPSTSRSAASSIVTAQRLLQAPPQRSARERSTGARSSGSASRRRAVTSGSRSTPPRTLPSGSTRVTERIRSVS